METQVIKHSRWTVARSLLVEILSGGIALVFLHAVYLMATNWEKHLQRMHEQVFNEWWVGKMAWVIPAVYLLIAGAIAYRPLRRLALWVAFGYVVFLSTYIVLSMTKAFGFYPCSCIGLKTEGTFQDNLWFNAKLSITILLAIALDRRWLVMVGTYLMNRWMRRKRRVA